jgi:UDP-2-acetamido-3-amino-2,3-dideoxy-glucuronate N-acetyltransferase
VSYTAHPTAIIDPGATIGDGTHIWHWVHVSGGATLGANSTIVCGVTIGEYAFIGAGAVITADVKPYALVVGVPGRQIGWMSQHGERLNLPLTGSGETTCPATGVRYYLQNGAVGIA